MEIYIVFTILFPFHVKLEFVWFSLGMIWYQSFVGPTSGNSRSLPWWLSSLSCALVSSTIIAERKIISNTLSRIWFNEIVTEIQFLLSYNIVICLFEQKHLQSSIHRKQNGCSIKGISDVLRKIMPGYWCMEIKCFMKIIKAKIIRYAK